jgi:hypothetical protein
MKYFKNTEFKDISKLDKGMLIMLDNYREILGYPVNINSDYEQSGHANNSEHYEGKAVDCSSKAPLWWQYICAERVGFENIGLYPNWKTPGLHLGIRGNESRRWIGLGSGKDQKYEKYNEVNFKKYIL